MKFGADLLTVLKQYGPTHPLSLKEIEKRVRMPGSKIKNILKRLWVKGVPICYTESGYFYAREYDHAKKTIEQFETKGALMLKIASAMKKKFEMSGQPTLFNN